MKKPPRSAGPRGGFRCADSETSATGSLARPVPHAHRTSEVTHDRMPVNVPMLAPHRCHDFLHSGRVVVANTIQCFRDSVNAIYPADQARTHPGPELRYALSRGAVSSTGRAKDF